MTSKEMIINIRDLINEFFNTKDNTELTKSGKERIKTMNEYCVQIFKDLIELERIKEELVILKEILKQGKDFIDILTETRWK